MKSIRVILVDDQNLFVESLRIVLESRAKDIKVLAVAYNGQEAVQYARELEPNVILMDVRMPGIDGVEATRIIHKKMPQIKIVMLTTFDNDEYVHNALRFGAVGYLLKNIAPLKLIACIRAVEDGIVQISPSVSEKLLLKGFHIAEGGERNYEESAEGNLGSALATLTKREKEVLNYLTKAYENREIAQRMFVAEQTLKNHVSVIYAKLGITSRIQLIKLLSNIDLQKMYQMKE